MKKSAGLVLIKSNKILLCHPTGGGWYAGYTIPKGGVEKDETNIEAAIRETKEEVGILIPEKYIKSEEYVIDYINKKGKLFKKVFYYIVDVDDLPDVLPKEQLQLEEIDWAGFMDMETAKEKIFWRFKPILEKIKRQD